MTSLPLVPRNTARKLFAHLHFLHTMAHANKMSAENLASVWAPTIMPAAMVSKVASNIVNAANNRSNDYSFSVNIIFFNTDAFTRFINKSNPSIQDKQHTPNRVVDQRSVRCSRPNRKLREDLGADGGWETSRGGRETRHHAGAEQLGTHGTQGSRRSADLGLRAWQVYVLSDYCKQLSIICFYICRMEAPSEDVFEEHRESRNGYKLNCVYLITFPVCLRKFH